MRKHAGGFSLVELLVAIGLIALLLGILLPTLARAREHARQVACASNIRQVAAAFLMYAGDHREQFPGPSVVLPTHQDWIYWQPNRDLPDGRIVRYLGKAFNESILRCPADTLVRIERNLTWFDKTYQYSYCVNQFIVGPWVPPVKLGQIKTAERMILIAEESEATINDGCWYPPYNRFATRHGRAKSANDELRLSHDDEQAAPDKHGRGNAAFVDGHVESISRALAHDPRYHLPATGHVPGPRIVLEGGKTLPPPSHHPGPPPTPTPNPTPGPG